MAKVKEKDILKALAELEELSLAKGDALEEADTEGGMSTEGAPLSNKAPSGRSTSKAMPPPPVDDDSSEKDASSSEDDNYSEDSDSSSDDESADDMSKSLRAAADEDETLRKAMDVSEYLEGFVDQTSDALRRLEKSVVTKLSSQVDDRFKSQEDFNTRLAQGVVGLGKLVKSLHNLVEQQQTIIKAFADSPSAGVPRGKALLSKSDIAPSPISDDYDDNLRKSLTPEAVVDWMIAHHVDPIHVTRYEAERYNINVLPSDVRKSLMADLAK